VLLKLPTLEKVARWPLNSVGSSVAFIPYEQALVVGKWNGEVQVYYDYALNSLKHEVLKDHPKTIQGIGIVPTNTTIITAGAEGTLHFTNWVGHKLHGSITIPEGKLTSLHISPDGAFMATGDSEASMSLWDIRVLDIPRLFTIPFAQASPDLLVTIDELATNPKLADNVRQSLTFIQQVLHYRFRFDIEIAEVPAIKVGEFDIEIE
jgi:WD40 repeat protein